ncbi:MAG: hypothetical protein MJY69_05415 [Bacteroidales bacterium]|nr:hypothetical protein [Bacteroidales bacterium]
MRKLLPLLILLTLVACDKSGTSSYANTSLKADPALKGIWKLVSVRFAGGNVQDMKTLYAIADPENSNLSLLLAVEEEADNGQGPVIDVLRLAADGDKLALVKLSDYDNYVSNPKGEFAIARIPYELFQGNDLHLFPEAAGLVPDEMIKQEPDIKDLHIEFVRDTELEDLARINTKADDDDWMQRAAQVLVEKVWTSVEEYGIDEEFDFVTSATWPNSQAWQSENWMSKLPDDMPVAHVNIPGSHDSSTTKGNMSTIADCTDAWVQTYSIEDQFKKGARYFDFRVGSSLVPCWLGFAARTMTDEERENTPDLKMYHGPLCTDTPFIGTMRKLAETILKDRTEFIIINVQAERESDGLCNTLYFEIRQKIFGDGSKDEFYAAVSEQTMDIANRLLKKFSRKYNDEIFIPYSMDLTVGEARGHIIIMESDKYMHYQCKSYYTTTDGVFHDEDWLRASFLSGWPDNRTGSATIYTYTKADSLAGNMYVQSYYEMKLDDKDKISRKEKAISDLASSVSRSNANPGLINVLGFNAMNANTGSVTGLRTYAFAHEFNGYCYEMYVDNMKNAGSSAIPFRCGIVPMDHYGATYFDGNKDIKVYGDKLSWAVIESNFK